MKGPRSASGDSGSKTGTNPTLRRLRVKWREGKRQLVIVINMKIRYNGGEFRVLGECRKKASTPNWVRVKILPMQE